MIHTFEIGTEISTRAAFDIRRFLGVSDEDDSYSTMEINVNGIAELILYPIQYSNNHRLAVVVNPAKLLYGFNAFETVPASEEIIERLSRAFIPAMAKAVGGSSFDFPRLPEWETRQIHYAKDIFTDRVSRRVELLNKGDKPNNYKDKTKKRNESCYLGSSSSNVNVYDKANEMADGERDPSLIALADGLLRFEIQCKSPKVSAIKKKRNFDDRSLKNFFSPDLAKEILLSYCERIFKVGDYYSLEKARVEMEHQNLSKDQISGIINIMKAIAQTRSISEARKQLVDGMIRKNTKEKLKYCKEQFRRNCSLLAELGINPVTIPRDWDIDHLEGIYSLLGNAFSREENDDHIR